MSACDSTHMNEYPCSTPPSASSGLEHDTNTMERSSGSTRLVSATSDVTIRRNQQAVVARQLAAVRTAFNDSEHAYKQKCKRRIQHECAVGVLPLCIFERERERRCPYLVWACVLSL